MEKQLVDARHVEHNIEVDDAAVAATEKPLRMSETAFVAEENDTKRIKTTAERRLVWKTDLLVLPLAALIYFSAYLVCGFVLFIQSILEKEVGQCVTDNCVCVHVVFIAMLIDHET